MPTMLGRGPYRFFFYAGDRGEPVHVHVERDDDIAKFRLDPDPLRARNPAGSGAAGTHPVRIARCREARNARMWNPACGTP